MTHHIDRVLSGLHGVRRRDTGWMALCPGHDDRSPSLSIDVADDGTILFKCFAGCEQGHLIERVSATAGIDPRELFPPKDAVLRSNGHGSSGSGHGTTPRPPAPWPGLTVAALRRGQEARRRPASRVGSLGHPLRGQARCAHQLCRCNWKRSRCPLPHSAGEGRRLGPLQMAEGRHREPLRIRPARPSASAWVRRASRGGERYPHLLAPRGAGAGDPRCGELEGITRRPPARGHPDHLRPDRAGPRRTEAPREARRLSHRRSRVGR